MRGSSLLAARSSVLATYPLSIVRWAGERGVSAERVLAGTGLDLEQLRMPEARMTLPQLTVLHENTLRETGDPSLGVQLGLQGSFTNLGLLGLGLMSCSTFRAAAEMGSRYLPIVASFLRMRFFIEGDWAVTEIEEAAPLRGIRQVAFDNILVEAAQIYQWLVTRSLAARFRGKVEIWFDTPELPYHIEYRDRMPAARFNMPRNQIRYATSLLDLPVRTANPLMERTVSDQCERELARLGVTTSIVDRVRGLLVCHDGRYPDLLDIASRLHVSERTLKRRLAAEGAGFAELLDEVRKGDSLRLLADPIRPIEEVAFGVGYLEASNFARAFRRWTGELPSAWRARRMNATT